MDKRKNAVLGIFFLAIAFFFVGCPIYSLFVKGVFRWHISQPALWRDAIELFLYFVVILVLSMLAKNKKGLFVLTAAVVYLLSAGTLTQCLVSYVYIEIIILLGRSFISLLLKKACIFSVGVNFLAGSVLWGGIALGMSLLRAGTIEHLRMLTIVLLLLAVVNPFSRISVNDFLVVKYVKYLNENKTSEFLINLFFVLVMFISCARVNTHIDFDSHWYALYTDRCLFGDNSFYDFLGYTDFVYYYPKFKELLMAPISGLGLPGYLISSNLWIMVICINEVFCYLIDNSKGNKNQVLSVVYLIFSSVCIVGISGTAKSDTISYLYILLMILYFMRYFKTRKQCWFWIAMAAGVMSYTVKFTSFLFSTIVFIVVFAVMICLLALKKLKLEKPDWKGILVFVMACIVFGGIMYRTYLITGYPTYREGKGIWDALGFQAQPYFDVDVNYKPGRSFDLNRIASALFDVQNSFKIRAQWIGNYSVYFALTFCLYRNRQKNDHKILLLIVTVLVLVSLWFFVTMPEPDGNYFSAVIIIATCYMLIRMTESACWDFFRKWFSVIVGMFMLLNLVFVFVTHPSWVTAVKFSEEPFSFIMSEEVKYEKKEDKMRALGVYEINEKLKAAGGKDFILVEGKDSEMCMMEARVEMAGYFFDKYLSGGGYIANYQDFLRYVDYAGVDGFVIAVNDSDGEPFYDYVKQYIVEYGCVEQVNTDKYSYYRITDDGRDG